MHSRALFRYTKRWTVRCKRYDALEKKKTQVFQSRIYHQNGRSGAMQYFTQSI